MLITALISAALAAPLKPALIEASTAFVDDSGVSYEATNAADSKVGSVWVEGDTAGSGLGSWIKYTFDSPKEIRSIQLWNGNWYSYDFWVRHNRVRELEIEFSDGSKQTFTLLDEKVPETITLPTAVTSDTIRFKIKSIYRGSTFNDTVFSEIIVYDSTSDGNVGIGAWSDSSHVAEDADGSYEPARMGDGIMDTMWCEGDSGDGTGQWIQADLNGSYTVSSMKLINGIGSGLALWMKGNRASSATLAFSNGSTQDVALKGSFLPQTVEFSPVNTSSVHITFTGITTGKEYNDLCISELSFQE